MSDRIIQGFRAHQYEDVTSLAKASDVVEILPVEGDPPARYIISVRAKGLIQGKADRIMEADRCDIMIWLPDDYLRRAEAVQVLTYLGPSRRPWHPNIRPPYICMNIRPGTPLVDLTYACFSLWTWDLYYTGDNEYHEKIGLATSVKESPETNNSMALRRRFSNWFGDPKGRFWVSSFGDTQSILHDLCRYQRPRYCYLVGT